MDKITMTQIDLSLLEHLPFGLLLLDQDGRVSWLNTTMQEMLDLPAAEVAGKTAAQLPEAIHQLIGGDSNLVQFGDSGRWLNRTLRRGEDGERLLIVQDVSDQEELAEENPLSTALIHVDLQEWNGVQPLSSEPAVLAVSRFLRDRLRWVDQIARWDENLFLLVLPETTEADARRLLDKIAGEQQGMELPESCGNLRPRLTFGLACWAKGDDMRTLLRHTLSDLQQNGAV